MTSNKKIFEIVLSAIKNNLVPLNKENKKFIEYIQNPLGFITSKPKKINPVSSKNHGETRYQREIYENIYDSKWIIDNTEWLDIELPIGREKRERKHHKRIDLIGIRKNKFILCELKYKQKPGNPFDALLQILAYYLMIKKNAKQLQEQNIYHINNKNKAPIDWIKLSKNPVLQIRAPKEYWENWSNVSKKNKTAREIIEGLKKQNLNIELFIDKAIKKNL